MSTNNLCFEKKQVNYPFFSSKHYHIYSYLIIAAYCIDACLDDNRNHIILRDTGINPYAVDSTTLKGLQSALNPYCLYKSLFIFT